MKALSIKNLIKTYADGTQALRGVDLEIEEGGFFALLGANGAGKTTLIGILTGLVNKTSGDAQVFGVNLDTHLSQAKELMGVVPQEMNFNIFEKVQNIILQQAGYYGIERNVAKQDLEPILKTVNLWDKRHQQSKTLSGGMKRRLMIARALINKPKLLILDEPTAGVDVELRHEMWDFLKDLNKKGTTILLTTHYLEEVEQLCQNAAMIKDGEILFNDKVRNLVNLVEKETFVVHVERSISLSSLESYKPVKIDEHMFEVELSKDNEINDFISKLCGLGVIIKDFRPKGSRMEKLFLEGLQKK